MAKPVQGRRCPATVTALTSHPDGRRKPGRPASGAMSNPRVKGNGISMASLRLRLPRVPRPLFPLLVVLTLLAAACGGPTVSGSPSPGVPSPSASAGYPLTLSDDTGRSVTVPAKPARIVSLAPSNTEIACALGACAALVGVTDF